MKNIPPPYYLLLATLALKKSVVRGKSNGSTKKKNIKAKNSFQKIASCHRETKSCAL